MGNLELYKSIPLEEMKVEGIKACIKQEQGFARYSLDKGTVADAKASIKYLQDCLNKKLASE